MTEPLGPQGQYASARPFFEKAKSSSSNLSGSPDDQDRLRAYALYEDMYFNRPESFRVFLRGEDSENGEIYIPSAKKMIEAMNRFLCKGFNFFVTTEVGEETDQNELILRLGNLFKREKMKAKFANQKRNGLIRGDVCWYITADPTKPQHSRISIHELNPSNYFPITDPNDKKRLLGCHIVEVVQDSREKDDKTKTLARRQTYLKAGVSFNTTHGRYEQAPGTTQQGIWHEISHWEIGKWDDRNMKQEDLERVTVPEDSPMTQLAAQITSLPVYHWKNGVSDTLFGNSELQGIETLVAGINQAATDEELTLVLQGLGVYATDSKPPVNADGSTAPWSLGPGAVVEHSSGTSFNRVSGVGSLAPYQEHINFLKEGMQEGNGIPDIAAGKVDVAVAESGVSLQLQLAPILASSKEKEEEILAVTDQMLYDLVTMWLPGYEQVSFGEAIATAVVDDPMPVNRDARIQEIMLLFTSSLITIAMAQAELAKLGYQFQKGDDIRVLREAAALAAAQSNDPEGNRVIQELEPRTRELNPGAGTEPGGLLGAGVEGAEGAPAPGNEPGGTVTV